MSTVAAIAPTLANTVVEQAANFARLIISLFGAASQFARDALDSLLSLIHRTTTTMTTTTVTTTTVTTTTTTTRKYAIHYAPPRITTKSFTIEAITVALSHDTDDDATASESDDDERAEHTAAETSTFKTLHDGQVDEERGTNATEDQEETSDEVVKMGSDQALQSQWQPDDKIPDEIPTNCFFGSPTQEIVSVWPTLTLDGLATKASFDWTIQVYERRDRDGLPPAIGSLLLQRRLLRL